MKKKQGRTSSGLLAVKRGAEKMKSTLKSISKPVTIHVAKQIAFGAVLALAVAALARATPGSLFAATPLVRSTATIGIHVMPTHVRIDDKTDPAQLNDVLVQKVVAQPGGFSGWLSHPGYGVVAVRAGVVALYDADDPTCTPRYVGAGEVFTEVPGHVHFVRNEGTVDYEAYATFILPVGVPSRTDEPSPGNCPF